MKAIFAKHVLSMLCRALRKISLACIYAVDNVNAYQANSCFTANENGSLSLILFILQAKSALSDKPDMLIIVVLFKPNIYFTNERISYKLQL